MSDAQLLDVSRPRRLRPPCSTRCGRERCSAGSPPLWCGAARQPAVRSATCSAAPALALMVAAWTATAWQHRGAAVPEAAAAARAGAAAPALGPAGPFDFSPAIRPISRAELEAGAPSWRYRLECWSVALVPRVAARRLRPVAAPRARLAVWSSACGERALLPVAEAVIARTRELAQRLAVARPVRVAQSAACRCRRSSAGCAR